MQPIDFYTFDTPNGRKVEILIEELQIPHRKHVVDIEKGEQKSPDFLAKNPNGKIPVIVDHAVNRTMFESCAILLYLAGKHGELGPTTEDERLDMQQWLFFQVGHIGPMIGQFWHFTKFADEKLPGAIARYQKECNRLFGVLNDRLSTRDYINDRYSITDIATWPWVDAACMQLGLSLQPFPHLEAWHSLIGTRPAVRRTAPHSAESSHANSLTAVGNRS